MNIFLVTWTHIFGGSNTERVVAKDSATAESFILDRQGRTNIVRVVSRKA